jgi:hypothetical protein
MSKYPATPWVAGAGSYFRLPLGVPKSDNQRPGNEWPASADERRAPAGRWEVNIMVEPANMSGSQSIFGTTHLEPRIETSGFDVHYNQKEKGTNASDNQITLHCS